VYLGLVKIAKNSLGEKYLTYFPFIFILTIFVLLSNLFGLIPFSFTPIAQLIVSLSLALSVFGAVNLFFSTKAFIIIKLGYYVAVEDQKSSVGLENHRFCIYDRICRNLYKKRSKKYNV